MIERHQVDNGNFLIPSGAQYPEWAIDRINKFQETIYSISNAHREPNEQALKSFTAALETYIIPAGVKITKALTKPEINKLIQSYAKVLNDEEFPVYIWLLMNAGFYLSTILPTCIDEDSLTVPEVIKERRLKSIEDFKKTGNKQAYLKEIQEISKEVLVYMTSIDNAFGDFINSKANGSLDHIQELLVGIGLAFNTKGEIIDTITNCLVDGVTQTDYFSKGSTGIGALFAKSSETAKPGYLGKKLSNMCEKVKLSNDRDCGTKRLLKINTKNKDFLESFIGQLYSPKNTPTDLKEFSKEDISSFISKDIYFRAPPYCKSPGHNICFNCYNQEFIRNHNLKAGDNIGLYASTGLTGSLVSLTLKKSHVGINLKTEKVNFLKDLGIE